MLLGFPVSVILRYSRPLTTVIFIKLQHQRASSPLCTDFAHFCKKTNVERFDMKTCLCDGVINENSIWKKKPSIFTLEGRGGKRLMMGIICFNATSWWWHIAALERLFKRATPQFSWGNVATFEFNSCEKNQITHLTMADDTTTEITFSLYLRTLPNNSKL